MVQRSLSIHETPSFCEPNGDRNRIDNRNPSGFQHILKERGEFSQFRTAQDDTVDASGHAATYLFKSSERFFPSTRYFGCCDSHGLLSVYQSSPLRL